MARMRRVAWPPVLAAFSMMVAFLLLLIDLMAGAAFDIDTKVYLCVLGLSIMLSVLSLRE